MDVEQIISGIKNGQIKKARVMSILRAILETKDYFMGRDSDGQNQILNLVSMFVDVIVSTFNYTGLFKTSETIDFTPVPVGEGGDTNED
jgi:hypothetical protein